MDAETQYWQTVYNQAAARFEEDWRVGRWVSPHYHGMVRECLDRLLGPFKGKGLRVLDVCCGPGSLLETLSGCGFPCVGLDCSRGVLERLKSHPARRNLTVLQADATATPFAAGSFDMVLSVGMLQCLQAPGSYLAELVRVLPAGQGRLILLFSPDAWLVNRRRRRAIRCGAADMAHYRLHAPEAVVSELRLLGFTDIRVFSLVYIFYAPLLRPLLRFMNRHMAQTRFLAPFATSTIIFAGRKEQLK